MEDRHLQKAMLQDPFIKALYGGVFPADGLLHISSPRGFYIFNTDETGHLLKKKFNSFKLKGILSLLSITCMTIVIAMTTISSLPSHKAEKETNITTVNMNTNNTLCDFIQSFSISGNVYLSICLYQETFRIDLRFFINKKETIKDLHLTTEEWQRLIKIIPIINNVLSRLSYKQ